jgi:hypothetical protein
LDADSGNLANHNLDRRRVLMTLTSRINSQDQVIMGDWIGWIFGIGGVRIS